MKIKTKDLTGPALDWAVGVSLGQTMRNHRGLDIPAWFDSDNKLAYLPASAYSPSTNWCHGGPLVDQFKPHFNNQIAGGYVKALTYHAECRGETYLIAICRAVVLEKIGYDVEVPDELVGEA